MVDRHGLPLVAGLTGAERPDATVFEALVAGIPATTRAHGRRRERPQKLHADEGYAVQRCRAYLRRRGLACRSDRKRVEDRARPGRHRRVVERTMAWRNHFRRSASRHERREDIHQALLDLGCALIGPRRPEGATQ